MTEPQKTPSKTFPVIPDGFYKISRLLFDSTLWNCPPNELRLAVYLLGKARHKKKPKKFPGFIVRRGELITSLEQISENCQWYENRTVRSWQKQKVSRMLDLLEKIGFLERKSDTYGTHLSICKYDFYQNGENYNSDGTVTESDDTVTNVLPYKKDKNEKKEIDPDIVSFCEKQMDYIKENYPTQFPRGKNVLKNSADTIDKIIRIDGIGFNEVKKALRWAATDNFWSKQIYSLASLRNKGDNGMLKIQNLLASCETKTPPKPIIETFPDIPK